MRRANYLVLLLPMAFAAALQAQEVKRLSKAEAVGAAVTKVQPEYPAVARQLKLEGPVEVEASIDESGAVTDVREVSGNPVLAKAAVAAVKRWRFTAFQSGGKPVKAVATLNFVFTR
jgi:protein TonB